MTSSSAQALRSAGILALFAAVGSGLLAAAHSATRDRIAANERAVMVRQLTALLPTSEYDNDLLADTLELELPPQLSPPGIDTVYRARRDGRPSALILPVTAPNGYSGAIDLLVGIRFDGRVASVRVLRHRETPGLGDGIEIERSDWIRQFADTTLTTPSPSGWRVRKDGGEFDQLTGATITPRAVIAAVRAALEFHQEARDSLYLRSDSDGER